MKADKIIIPRAERPRRPVTTASWVIIALAVVAMTASLWSLRQETLVTQYQYRVDNQILPDGTMQPPAFPPLPAAAPPRTLVAEALYRARVAAVTPDASRRRAQLTVARAAITQAIDSRPHWGEAWVVKAYIESIASPRLDEAEKNALARSYLDAPFMHVTGLWRAQRAISNWDAFSPFAQNRIANEMVWLIRFTGGQTRAGLLETVRNSPAYFTVFMRLRAANR
ncbi:MAG TPA: hypothetical protein VF503_26615 [Sphingobium sp.]|uniref:hypothetical protein n=1 Tax=Sphingobium sp. TaxID=1912891 RepID=UPI002ED20699